MHLACSRGSQCVRSHTKSVATLYRCVLSVSDTTLWEGSYKGTEAASLAYGPHAALCGSGATVNESPDFVALVGLIDRTLRKVRSMGT